MSELLSDTPLMTIKEFRKLTGQDTAHLTDAEVEKHIDELTILGQMYIKQRKARKEHGGKENST